jgi:hypothetical protein
MPVRDFFSKPTVLPEAQPGLQIAQRLLTSESEARVKSGADWNFGRLTHLTLKLTDAFKLWMISRGKPRQNLQLPWIGAGCISEFPE